MDSIHLFDDELHPDFHFSIDHTNDYDFDSPNDYDFDSPNDYTNDSSNDYPIDYPIDLDTTTQFFGFSNRKRFTQLHLLNSHFSHILFVESPAKARLFSHFLPSHFFIFPTFGSFFFLPHLKLISFSFTPSFLFKPFAHFAKLFSTFLHILFATDTDRDGESFSHIFLFPIYATVIKKCI
jgi:hypothetical protein